MISKEKATQTAEKEEYHENIELKKKADPVFFISLVGVNANGFVDDDEHVYDIYTKDYDFGGSSVRFMSAQDLWEDFNVHHKQADRKKVPIYNVVESFVKRHPNGHFVIDECPFLQPKYSKRSFYI